MQGDTYKTISKPSEGIFKDKGSKFLAFAYSVYSEEEVKEILKKLRKEEHNARHHCYAYRLGIDKKIYRVNDDGEPSNSAGKPILGQIQSKDLTNILIVVVRYFGGTLLGIGGLINAYRSAAADALNNAEITTKTVDDKFEITYDYAAMNDVMKIIKDEKLEHIIKQDGMSCCVSLSIRKSHTGRIIERLKKIGTLEVKFIQTV